MSENCQVYRPKAASKPHKNDEYIYDEIKRLRKENAKTKSRPLSKRSQEDQALNTHRAQRQILENAGITQWLKASFIR